MIREQIEQGNIKPAPPLPELRAQPIIEEEYSDLEPWMARNRLPTPYPSSGGWEAPITITRTPEQREATRRPRLLTPVTSLPVRT
jgi:hypothetical protein